MTRISLAATAAALGFAMVVGSTFVPAITGEAGAATRQERAAMRAQTKMKRAECNREAKGMKLGFIKRSRFVSRCMKRG